MSRNTMPYSAASVEAHYSHVDQWSSSLVLVVAAAPHPDNSTHLTFYDASGFMCFFISDRIEKDVQGLTSV